jgi:endonuclease/exonuclease/phosphatase family metal-dependent hydrolase
MKDNRAGIISEDGLSGQPSRAGSIDTTLALAWIVFIYRWFCRLFFAGCTALAVLILWTGIAIESSMEENLFLAVISYIPIWVPLIPVVLLLPLALVFSRGALLLLVVSGLTYYFLHWHPHIHRPLARTTELSQTPLRVMSFNAGQSRQVDFQRLLGALEPDIVLLQDARGWLKRKEVAPGAAQFPFRQEAGEFVLLSKHPLADPGSPALSIQIKGRERMCVYRHRLLVSGRQVTIFNAHMPSPRELLRWHGGKGTFLLGLVHWLSSGLDSWHEERVLAWSERAHHVRKLAGLVAQESGITLVAGDLNTPPWGGGYAALAEIMDDAFVKGGAGFGGTFPAESGSLPSIAVPWLRLDYLFVSRGISIADWKTHKTGQMQHLPICAELTLPE